MTSIRKQAEALAKVADDYAADYCSGVDIPDNAAIFCQHCGRKINDINMEVNR